jgi:hypothetical protein
MRFPSSWGLRQGYGYLAPMVESIGKGQPGFDRSLKLVQAKGELTPRAEGSAWIGEDTPRGKWFWHGR